ncbi:serine hydrolase domain-containing protein [Adhaeribacter radiodurans]|uniref:Beta-lactamase family protein n=1 Tax=Adhaeribacter radiodurans TaxID=2745197 RepID=A0A7L7LDL3_9BACT|nr:serine hydrolase domain-containing protein [Adhaeribacter radiodurans]QMU30625.1 beta-lactamase family protein [Adhaeribacter radiodurans]
MVTITTCVPDSCQNADQVLVKELINANAPSVQYMVFNQNMVLYHFQQGLANIKDHEIVRDETTFNAYSLTKTFTALAVLQLVEQGKVDLEASVSTYLPDCPYPAEITIKHLLTHTSGIADPIPLSWVHLVEEDSTFNEKKFFKTVFEKNRTLKFKPGEKFKYSNLGYVLLGQVIAAVSGISYEKYITQNIISKLNLPPGALGFQIYDTRNHATGYHKKWSFSNLLLSCFINKSKFMGKAENSWQPFKFLYVNGKAYGGLIGTTNGLVKYLQEFLKPETRLISQANKRLLLTETKTANDKNTGMCLAWFTGELNGTRYYTHAGGGGGFYLEMRIYPEKGIGSLIVFNRSGMSDERFLNQVDKFFVQ